MSRVRTCGCSRRFVLSFFVPPVFYLCDKNRKREAAKEANGRLDFVEFIISDKLIEPKLMCRPVKGALLCIWLAHTVMIKL